MFEYETIDNQQRQTVTAGWLRNYLRLVKARHTEFGVTAKTTSTGNPRMSKEKFRKGILDKISCYYPHEKVHYIIWAAVKEEWPPERWLYDEK